jgi:hypothetical protein
VSEEIIKDIEMMPGADGVEAGIAKKNADGTTQLITLRMNYQAPEEPPVEPEPTTKDINLPLGKTTVTIPVSVTYKAYIDLERVTMHNIDIIDKKNIAIILPDPVLVETAVNIDHSNEKMDKEIFGKKLTHEKYRELVRDAKKQAWEELPEEDQRAIIERAKLSATELLIPQLKALGFENIVIDYSKNFSLRDMVREKL